MAAYPFASVKRCVSIPDAAVAMGAPVLPFALLTVELSSSDDESPGKSSSSCLLRRADLDMKEPSIKVATQHFQPKA